MGKTPRFQDKNGVIEAINSRNFKDGVRELFALANYLHDIGFKGVDFTVSHKSEKSTSTEFYYDYEGKQREHKVPRTDDYINGRFKVPPFLDVRIALTTKEYADSGLYEYPGDDKPRGIAEHHDPKEMSFAIRWQLREQVVKAYGNEYTPDKKRPKLTLIRDGDDGRYPFIDSLVRDVEKNTKGVKIPVIEAKDYVPPPSFKERILKILRLVAPAAQPLAALPAPVKPVLPENIATLPERFSQKLAEIKDKNLQKLGAEASEKIAQAVTILTQNSNTAAPAAGGVTTVFNHMVRRQLQNDLVVINLGLEEFDFSSGGDNLTKYFLSISKGLGMRFDAAQEKIRDAQQTGQEIALQQLQQRFPGLELADHE